MSKSSNLFFVAVAICGYKFNALYYKHIYKMCTVIIQRKAL